MTNFAHHFTENDRFEIGGENLLTAALRAVATPAEPESERALEKKQKEALANIQIRIGTLLKTETVSILLGAGSSVECGGQLIGSVPLAVERTLQKEGVSGTDRPRIRRWLMVFYLAVNRLGEDENNPVTRAHVLERRKALDAERAEPLRVNFEQVLALLNRWRAALPVNGGRLRLDELPIVDVTSADLDECLTHATQALASSCELPVKGTTAGLGTFKIFIRKLLTRPLNLKRVNIFTLNYDTLVEQASDAEGVVLLDGFVGTQRRTFRPESYEQDLYFPAETTEGRVHRFDRVLHLYKLHGSITWIRDQPTIDNPYGVISTAFNPQRSQPLLIYPTPAKYGETLGMPYSELFRRFAAALVRPQSALFVLGYGFGDEHVNAIVRQALAMPSFTLVVVDPNPMNDFVTTLRAQNDHRVWICEGSTLGRFSGFVNQVLPDLRDEEIRKKIEITHRALARSKPQLGDDSDGD